MSDIINHKERCTCTMETLMTRKSIRHFLKHEIPSPVIEKVLRAGAQAPSGGNCQPWRFVVVTDKEKIKSFDPKAEWQPFVSSAPAIIVACADPHDTWDSYDENDQCWILDTSAAIENILIAIHAHGLGAVWTLSFTKNLVRSICKIPKHWQIISIIPFGYYDPEDKRNQNTRPRRPLGEVAYFNDAETPFK